MEVRLTSASAFVDATFGAPHPLSHRRSVRAHIFLCQLVYYVEWHMREPWRELMFADTEQKAKATRDPVAPAKRSAAALLKIASQTLDDGTLAHSFSTLLAELATIVRKPAVRQTPTPLCRLSICSPRPIPSSTAHSN
jgi:hypothetical protein